MVSKMAAVPALIAKRELSASSPLLTQILSRISYLTVLVEFNPIDFLQSKQIIALLCHH